MGLIVLHFGLQRAARVINVTWAQFNLLFSFIFLYVLHGLNLLKILVLLTINYYISKNTTGRVLVISSWAFGISLLFLNELYEGYPFRNCFPPLAFLDEYAGMMPRWDVNFNFSMIRMISFNMDYLQANSSDHHPKVFEKDVSLLLTCAI